MVLPDPRQSLGVHQRELDVGYAVGHCHHRHSACRGSGKRADCTKDKDDYEGRLKKKSGEETDTTSQKFPRGFSPKS